MDRRGVTGGENAAIRNLGCTACRCRAGAVSSVSNWAVVGKFDLRRGRAMTAPADRKAAIKRFREAIESCVPSVSLDEPRAEHRKLRQEIDLLTRKGELSTRVLASLERVFEEVKRLSAD